MEQTKNYIKRLGEARLKLVERTGALYPEPSWVRMTTITMTSRLDQKLDVQQFKENFRKIGLLRIRIKNSKTDGFVWRMKETSFYNQVTIYTRDHMSTKSVKLFPNGSVQVAGCSHLVDCNLVTAQIAHVVKVVMRLAELPVLEAPTIQMINTNFSLNCSVDLYKVIDKFSKLPGFNVTFDPEKYSAVKIKFCPAGSKKEVTGSIFSTGKVIVTGARTLDEIVDAYYIINSTITEAERYEKSETVQMFDVFMGAKMTDLISKLNSE